MIMQNGLKKKIKISPDMPSIPPQESDEEEVKEGKD